MFTMYVGWRKSPYRLPTARTDPSAPQAEGSSPACSLGSPWSVAPIRFQLRPSHFHTRTLPLLVASYGEPTATTEPSPAQRDARQAGHVVAARHVLVGRLGVEVAAHLHLKARPLDDAHLAAVAPEGAVVRPTATRLPSSLTASCSPR